VLYFGTKGALWLARAVFEHAGMLLDRGFEHEEISDGFQKAAGWCVEHKKLELSPKLIMLASRAVKVILSGKEGEGDAGGLGVSFGAIE